MTARSGSSVVPVVHGLPGRSPRVVDRLRQVPLPTLFVMMALPVGVFLVFAQPPGQGLDEADHFYRVWTLAHGAVVAPSPHGRGGGYLQPCVTQYFSRFSAEAGQRGAFSFLHYWQSPTGCSQKAVFTAFPNSAVYSPVAYIPSLFAVVILRTFDAPLPVIFFAGRLFSLLAFVGLFYLAIRITPVGKQVLFVLGLLPTTLLLASCYSEDPMTIALAALAVGLTLRCCRAVEVRKPDLVLLLLVLLGLALAKPTNFIFAFLVFMIPAGALSRWRRPLLVKTAPAVLILVCAGLWYLAIRNDQAAAVPIYALDPHTQTHYILDHPLGYIAVLARTFFESSGEQRWLPGFFFSIGYARRFNADNIYAPFGLVVLGSLTLAYAFRLQFGVKRICELGSRLLVWLPVALAVVGVLLTTTTLFVYGTPVGLPESTIQGRYLLLLLPLPLITIGLLREVRVARFSTRWIVLGSTVMLIWLVLKVFVHDYSL
jgi:uncharacterized membrane protein